MWINPNTNQIFKNFSEIRKHFSYISFPITITDDIILDELGLKCIVETPKPEFNKFTHKIVESIPEEIDNDYYQTWDLIPLTQEETNSQLQMLQEAIVSETQNRLDEFARTRNYDGILSLCTYATSSIEKFQQEGQYGVEIRDQTWAMLYQILDEVNNQIRPIPESFDEIESELPELVWPE